MDETGVMLCMLTTGNLGSNILGFVKVLISKNDPRDYRGAGVKRTMVTAIECISADAVTHRSNWTTFPTPGWHYACSESGYTDSKISFEWLKRVFDPQTKGRANEKPRVLICDGFGTHESLEILEFCLENNIILCRLPSHTSHKLQPSYRERVERLFEEGTNTVGKEHFTSLYSFAREKAFTKRNITSAWAVCEIDAKKAAAYLQYKAVQTPVTPVSAEGLMSLYDQIKQDTQKLDTTSTQRLQKLSFAECALLNNRNQFLTKANNEAKVRRSTSYEDIEEARAKRAAKDAIKSKGKRGRKRKNTEPEASEASEAELDTKKAKRSKGTRIRRRRSTAIEACEPEAEPETQPELQPELQPEPQPELQPEPQPEPQLEPAPWRAPVARMY
ncbi:DDE-domain-containing protein [Cadophora sp. DSE1049]|nr:DDE-domain-containing protein [Cadophora sp. DSE1049]